MKKGGERNISGREKRKKSKGETRDRIIPAWTHSKKRKSVREGISEVISYSKTF